MLSLKPVNILPVLRTFKHLKSFNFLLKSTHINKQSPWSLHLIRNNNDLLNGVNKGLSQTNNGPLNTILMTVRGKYSTISQKCLNLHFGLLLGGGAVLSKTLRIPKHVLCQISENTNHTVHAHHPKKRFILFRLILSFISLIRLVLRAMRLIATFFPILLLYPFTIPSRKLKKLWWILLLWAVEFSGPAFIKLGQWASTRRDLFSKDFCNRFQKLHHQVKAHSWKHTCKSLRKAFGKNWKDILLFDKDAQPIGSGCVAQVYKAYVREDKLSDVELELIQEEIHEHELAYEALMEQRTFAEGVVIEEMSPFKGPQKHDDHNVDEEPIIVTAPGVEAKNFDENCLIPVALKVLHPNVRETFARDLTLMYAAARAIEFVIPSLRWISLTECVTEFSKSMKRQMNLKHEARCVDKLVHNFLSDETIRIPIPLWPLVTRDVLVETFEEGEPISKFLTDGDDETTLRKKLAELGVDALLQMVFVHNFVHGDLHPGNILVQNAEAFKENIPEEQLVMVNVGDEIITGVTKAVCPVKLVFLDCGITATLSESDRVKFREVFTAVVKGEGKAVADLFLKKTAHVECVDHEAFIEDMSAVVMKARKETLSLSQIHVGELLSEVFQVLRKHHVKLESNFSTVILAIAVLEGLGRSLDPDLDILEKAKPVLIHETLFS